MNEITGILAVVIAIAIVIAIVIDCFAHLSPKAKVWGIDKHDNRHPCGCAPGDCDCDCDGLLRAFLAQGKGWERR